MTRYIYKITNLINGKIYVGQHKWNGEGLDPDYFCSSCNPHFWNAVNKYGRSNFTKEIIQHCYSDAGLDAMERLWIRVLNSTNPEVGYNLIDGPGSWNYVNSLPNIHDKIADIRRENGTYENMAWNSPESVAKVQKARKESGYYESESFQDTLTAAHSKEARAKAEATMKGRKNRSKILWIDKDLNLHVMSYQNKISGTRIGFSSAI